MQVLFRIEVNGKPLGNRVFQSKPEAEKHMAKMIEASEKRLARAFKIGDLRIVNTLQSLHRTIRNGIRVAEYSAEEFLALRGKEIEQMVEQTNYSKSANRYKRISSVHRKYGEI